MHNVSKCRVVDFKITQHDYNALEPTLNSGYKYKLSELERATLKKLLPQPGACVSFGLRDTNVCIANAYRRIMLDEIVHPHFDVQPYGMITSDDNFINASLYYMRQKFNLIPVSYVEIENDQVSTNDVDPDVIEAETRVADTYKFELVLHNTTDTKILITSDMIRACNKKSESVRWAEHIEIMYLGAGKHISVRLYLKWGINRYHASFTHFAPVTFRQVGYDKKPRQPLAPGELGELPESYSLITSNFDLSFQVAWFDDPLFSYNTGWTTLVGKLDRAVVDIEQFIAAGGSVPTQTETLHISQTRDKLIVYEFIKETYTLSNILAWYAYALCPSIAYVHSADAHPEIDSCCVRINHPEHARLLVQAARAALADIKKITG